MLAWVGASILRKHMVVRAGCCSAAYVHVKHSLLASCLLPAALFMPTAHGAAAYLHASTQYSGVEISTGNSADQVSQSNRGTCNGAVACGVSGVPRRVADEQRWSSG